jgi:SET domain-containing protein
MRHLIIFLLIIVGFILIKCVNFEGFTNTNIIVPIVEIKESPKGGLGVYSNRDYNKGDIIELCPGIINKYTEIKGKIKDYVFKYDDDNSFIAFGYCSMYNHSDDPNAVWKVLNERELKVYAIKDIKSGEEILISYGDKYWNTRSIEKK